jgi:hypothetical protein
MMETSRAVPRVSVEVEAEEGDAAVGAVASVVASVVAPVVAVAVAVEASAGVGALVVAALRIGVH